VPCCLASLARLAAGSTTADVPMMSAKSALVKAFMALLRMF